jgi:hypothetical protein
MNRELASRLFAAVLLSLLGGWGATVKGRADWPSSMPIPKSILPTSGT